MYISRNNMAFCDIECATKYAFKNKDKGKQIKHREQKRNFKISDISHQHELTQKAFNKMRVLQEKLWFKERGLEPECISCGKKSMDWCCGHFKAVGAHGRLRYDEKNTYLQCNRYCNKGLSGNIYGNKNTRGYIKGLYDRFGQEADKVIDYCESNTMARKWTGDELASMRKEFNLQIRILKGKLI